MAQARRKPPAGARGGRHRIGFGGIAPLLAGMVIGAGATILWQGARTADGGIGAGLRQLVGNALHAPPAGAPKTPAPRETPPPKPSTDFSFFTVLPEIEVVAPLITDLALDAPAAHSQNPAAAENPAAVDSAYMLQAGSYRRRPDADRLKATLALNGMASTIQKVSIQGRGDFYRVRLGPYASYQAMAKADEQLSRAGIKALRLKMKSG